MCMTLLTASHAVDLGPVSLHKTRCLSNRFKDCEECYVDKKLAMCHRLSLGKFHKLVAWTDNRTEDIASAKEVITEACDYLMDKDTDTDSITCTGFKNVFVNEGSSLESGGPDILNANGALNICVKVFVDAGFGCASGSVVISVDVNGNNIGIVITISLSVTCQPPISVFNTALATLQGSPNFDDVFVNEPMLDFIPTGNSTLSLPFLRE